MEQKKYYIETFGCQMNFHDSEKISGVLKGKGYTAAEHPRESHLIIFNTCSIRQKAEQKFFSKLGRIKRLKDKNPHLKIAVAGCIAQQQGGEILKRAPFVDFVVGPQNIHLLRDLIHTDETVIATGENPDIALHDLPVTRKTEVKAWVSIMFGCNNFCSYCIVPYTRGREQSRSSESIVAEIQGLADAGFKEITLLGQNVNSYHSDVDFPGLLRKINAIEGIERIRYVTSHPRDLSDELIRSHEELGKVCEHIHLPLQSGADRILKRMNRGYTYRAYLEKVQKIRELVGGISITTDIIAGFPGEKEEEHLQTIKALREMEFDGIFAFKFSQRPGTKASLLSEQVPDTVKSQRLVEILAVQDDITEKINSRYIDTIQEVLVEGQSERDKDMLTGRTRNNKIVNFPGSISLRGTLKHIRISGAMRHSLRGDTA